MPQTHEGPNDPPATDSIEALRDLEKQVRNMIRERADIERNLANPEALRSATARAYRDRDAVTSSLLEEAREQIAADVAELHHQWREIDKSARNVDRLQGFIDEAPEHIKAHRDAIIADLPAVLQFRATIGRTLTSAGLGSLIPEDDGADV